MALWRLFYHIVWTTKNREPLIASEAEDALHHYIRSKSQSLECLTHAIGGMEDHIHIVVSIPPRLSISQYIKIIKGSSARFFNTSLVQDQNFSWQNTYGVFSFGESQIDRAIHYVRNQKQHHAAGTLNKNLELID
jgi:putative transposase